MGGIGGIGGMGGIGGILLNLGNWVKFRKIL